MHFQTNIKFLRERKQRSQEVVANELNLKRATLNNYENGYSKANIEMLPFFSKYYRMSIDTLINVDLSRLSESQLSELEMGHDAFIRGSKLRVLASTVDSSNRENIELVPLKAKAGYTAGYNDPEFISGLPTYQLPFVSADRKYRSFQIDGDSMLPIPDKSYVLGEYMQNWHDVKDGNAYVVLTLDEGLVFKVLYNKIKTQKKFLLRSLNPAYKPYEIDVENVKEIWKFVNYTSSELPETLVEKDQVLNSVADLNHNIYNLLSKVESSLKKK